MAGADKLALRDLRKGATGAATGLIAGILRPLAIPGQGYHGVVRPHLISQLINRWMGDGEGVASMMSARAPLTAFAGGMIVVSA